MKYGRGKQLGFAKLDNNDNDSYDVRADLHLGPRTPRGTLVKKKYPKFAYYQATAYQQKQQERQSRPDPVEAFRQAEPELRDDEDDTKSAREAAEALGRDLEAMGYNLDNTESFLTLGSSSTASTEDAAVDKYAKTTRDLLVLGAATKSGTFSSDSEAPPRRRYRPDRRRSPKADQLARYKQGLDPVQSFLSDPDASMETLSAEEEETVETPTEQKLPTRKQSGVEKKASADTARLSETSVSSSSESSSSSSVEETAAGESKMTNSIRKLVWPPRRGVASKKGEKKASSKAGASGTDPSKKLPETISEELESLSEGYSSEESSERPIINIGTMISIPSPRKQSATAAFSSSPEDKNKSSPVVGKKKKTLAAIIRSPNGKKKAREKKTKKDKKKQPVVEDSKEEKKAEDVMVEGLSLVEAKDSQPKKEEELKKTEEAGGDDPKKAEDVEEPPEAKAEPKDKKKTAKSGGRSPWFRFRKPRHSTSDGGPVEPVKTNDGETSSKGGIVEKTDELSLVHAKDSQPKKEEEQKKTEEVGGDDPKMAEDVEGPPEAKAEPKDKKKTAKSGGRPPWFRLRKPRHSTSDGGPVEPVKTNDGETSSKGGIVEKTDEPSSTDQEGKVETTTQVASTPPQKLVEIVDLTPTVENKALSTGEGDKQAFEITPTVENKAPVAAELGDQQAFEETPVVYHVFSGLFAKADDDKDTDGEEDRQPVRKITELRVETEPQDEKSVAPIETQLEAPAPASELPKSPRSPLKSIRSMASFLATKKLEDPHRVTEILDDHNEGFDIEMVENEGGGLFSTFSPTADKVKALLQKSENKELSSSQEAISKPTEDVPATETDPTPPREKETPTEANEASQNMQPPTAIDTKPVKAKKSKKKRNGKAKKKSGAAVSKSKKEKKTSLADSTPIQKVSQEVQTSSSLLEQPKTEKETQTESEQPVNVEKQEADKKKTKPVKKRLNLRVSKRTKAKQTSKSESDVKENVDKKARIPFERLTTSLLDSAQSGETPGDSKLPKSDTDANSLSDFVEAIVDSKRKKRDCEGTTLDCQSECGNLTNVKEAVTEEPVDSRAPLSPNSNPVSILTSAQKRSLRVVGISKKDKKTEKKPSAEKTDDKTEQNIPVDEASRAAPWFPKIRSFQRPTTPKKPNTKEVQVQTQYLSYPVEFGDDNCASLRGQKPASLTVANKDVSTHTTANDHDDAVQSTSKTKQEPASQQASVTAKQDKPVYLDPQVSPPSPNGLGRVLSLATAEKEPKVDETETKVPKPASPIGLGRILSIANTFAASKKTNTMEGADAEALNPKADVSNPQPPQGLKVSFPSMEHKSDSPPLDPTLTLTFTALEPVKSATIDEAAPPATPHTWNTELVDASKLVNSTLDRVDSRKKSKKKVRADQKLDPTASLISTLSGETSLVALEKVLENDDVSLTDIEKALALLKHHASRLGVQEEELLQQVKSQDTLFSSFDDETVRTVTLGEELMEVFKSFKLSLRK